MMDVHLKVFPEARIRLLFSLTATTQGEHS